MLISEMDRRITDFATRSFRDMADRDYIAARMACRAELMPQFLWSSQQAIEKYLKYILLVNRIPAIQVKHDIRAALVLTETLPFEMKLQNQSKKFIEHVATYGQSRYLEIPSFILGEILLDLDSTIWDLRRYCQVLDVRDKELDPSEQDMLSLALRQLEESTIKPYYKFKLAGGFLESVINKKSHPSHSALLWQNAFFSNRSRKKIKLRNHLQAINTPLDLYPPMAAVLKDFIYLSKATILHYEEKSRSI